MTPPWPTSRARYRCTLVPRSRRERAVGPTFFSRRRTGTLTSPERHLLAALTHLGERPVAVLATSRVSTEGTLRHECNHGVYFADPAYADRVRQLWATLGPEAQEFVRQTLGTLSQGHLAFDLRPDVFLTESSAHFRDPNVLLRDYFRNPTDATRTMAAQIEGQLRRLDTTSAYYR